MYTHGVEFEILTINGNPVTEYNKDGKTYIEGRHNSRYSIRISNKRGKRILVVPTVDGLSVIDGKKAGLDSQGYILNPYQSYDIEGWRISNEKIRQFFFTTKSNSYSNKVGEGTNNLGVIGLAVFEEQEQYQRLPGTWPWRHDSTPRPMFMFGNETHSGPNIGSTAIRGLSSSASLNTVQNQVGTGMGETRIDRVSTASFDRKKTPLVVKEIYYKERRELEKMGITIKNNYSHTPSAFPKETFCAEV